MTLCRICDSAVPEERVRFLDLVNDQPVFEVDCPHCGLPTYVDDQGDVLPNDLARGG